MARGWESKAVEDQIDSARADKEEVRQKAAVTAQEREQLARKQSLLLSRSRIVSLLETARNERYRAQLQRTLEHLDAELQKLGRADDS